MLYPRLTAVNLIDTTNRAPSKPISGTFATKVFVIQGEHFRTLFNLGFVPNATGAHKGLCGARKRPVTPLPLEWV